MAGYVDRYWDRDLPHLAKLVRFYRCYPITARIKFAFGHRFGLSIAYYGHGALVYSVEGC